MSNCSTGWTTAVSKPPAVTREHHDQFCETERWQLVRGATGRPVKHHRTYELPLWDGRILRTRISQPIDKSTYAPSMWSHILRTQLDVTAKEFWACVNDGVIPDRGGPAVATVREALPLHLVRSLTALGVPEDEVLSLTPREAAELLAKKYTETEREQ